MPELPEVETVKRGLAPYIEGQTINALRLSDKPLRAAPPNDVNAHVKNTQIIGTDRRGKYLLLSLSNNMTLIHHLGMSGSFRIEKEPEKAINKKHDHIIYEFQSGGRIVFHDPRRFGMLFICDSESVETHKAFANMGPEPLGNPFNASILREALKNKKAPIKTALLDQTVVAGLGNIYVCEALFSSSISPLRLASSLSLTECEILTREIKNTLNKAIESGGSSLRDHIQVDGKLGYFQHTFSVYDKQGLPCSGCTCNISKTGGVKRVKQAGRSTFYCATKQK